jgi:hypothetical protein
VYNREQVIRINDKLNELLASIIEHHKICADNGKLAKVTTHCIRHTFATVAKNMGKRVDQIQDALGHSNLDMQDYYVGQTPQQREESTILVNFQGKEIVYKTDKNIQIRREWKIREIEIGLCGRPSIHQKCENEYICLGCDDAYYGKEHLPQLEVYLKRNEEILEKAEKKNQSDSIRANSARQIIDKVKQIIQEIKQRGL